jgi:hypothetical protein
MLHESYINSDDKEISLFRDVFSKISNIRAGHTAVMTLKTLDEGKSEDIITQYRFRSQIGSKIWHTPFEVILPKDYAGKTCLIDAKKFADRRHETAFSYDNPLEQYIRLKTLCPDWKTELDLFYLWDDDNWTSTIKSGHSLMLLAPSKIIPENQRIEMIRYGSSYMDSDMALIWNSDAEYVDSKDIVRIDAGEFKVLSRYSGEYLKKTANDILKYQGLL